MIDEFALLVAYELFEWNDFHFRNLILGRGMHSQFRGGMNID